jgi:hypothetical protein
MSTFAAAVVHFLRCRTFGTGPLGAAEVAFLVPFPLLVWGADELRRAMLGGNATAAPAAQAG